MGSVIVDVMDSCSDSSPEYLLPSDPLTDPYSSQDSCGQPSTQQSKKIARANKFISDIEINSHDVHTWEMAQYLQATFELCDPTQSLTEQPSVERLVEESLKFVFPDGSTDWVPQDYTEECSLHTARGDITTRLCEDFFARDQKYEWFRDNYTTDYTTAEGRRSFFPELQKGQKNSQRNNWKENRKNCYSKAAANLSARIHQTMSSLLEAESKAESKSIHGGGGQGNSRDKVSGMLREMMAFLDITILYTGESRLDFSYHYSIPGRHVGGPVFNIQPNLTLCTQSWPEDQPTPFCVIQVCSPSESEDISQETNLLEETEPCLHLKDNQDIADEVRAGEWDAKIPAESTPLPNTQTFHLSQKYKEKIHKKKIGNKNRFLSSTSSHTGRMSSDCTLNTLAGQFPMEMYGLLVNKLKIEKKDARSFNRQSNFTALGLYVVNERVYLARVVHDSNSLMNIVKEKANLPEIACGPGFCLTDWFFNVKRPAERLALMVFMYHYARVMEKQNPL